MTFYLAMVNTKDLKKVKQLEVHKMAKLAVRNSSDHNVIQ